MAELRYTEIGKVKSIRGCIVVVEGFTSCINGQLVHFGFGTSGTILGFDEKEAHVLIVKQIEEIKTGDEVQASLEPFNVPVGENFIGRIVTSLCEPFDGLGPIKEDAYYPIFPAAPGILERQVLSHPLETGTKVLDSMIPVGLGQRQLILGNKMTGKTTIVTDTILNQKNTEIICIYCAIGKARSQLARVVQLFQDNDAFEYTTIVAAPSSTPPGQQYLAPYVACSLGEYFMQRGKHVFIGFDDFTKHAWCYREISLLLGRPPGRDSYPGDIFYLHSKMIERACYLDEERGGGSMTFLPIVEILEGDLTAFVPSNLVSMTDGQIMLDSAMFGEGQKPALDLGLSVSRTGTKVQWPIVKDMSGPLRLEYLQFRETKKASRLRSGPQSDEVIEKFKNGDILTKLLQQDKDSPVPMEGLVFILFAFKEKHFHDLEAEQIDQFQEEILAFAEKKDANFLKILRERRKMDDEIQKGLASITEAYINKLKGISDEEVEKQQEDITTDIGAEVLKAAAAVKNKSA
ncbi:ATP synthase alpha chain [hydrothermal vent metagenome]|uniref:ATP synthase alpha chain n=1 Tax=hydrothermal vent metagenome TaxID=652676 RepID=A0A3B1DCN2_9ZZZZ